MSVKITGKKVGDLIISSDYVTTATAVESYVSNVSAALQQAIDSIGSGFVPLSALSSAVLNVISSNYEEVANYLDGTPEDGVVTIDCNNI